MAELWGVLLGGALTLAGGGAMKFWEYYRDKQALRRGIAAEIASILEMDALRDYGSMFRAAADEWRNGNTSYRVIFFGIEVDTTPIYGANQAKLGLLGPDVAADVVHFYAMLRGIKIDLKAYADGDMASLGNHNMTRVAEQDLELWTEARVLGLDLIKRLS